MDSTDITAAELPSGTTTEPSVDTNSDASELLASLCADSPEHPAISNQHARNTTRRDLETISTTFALAEP